MQRPLPKILTIVIEGSQVTGIEALWLPCKSSSLAIEGSEVRRKSLVGKSCSLIIEGSWGATMIKNGFHAKVPPSQLKEVGATMLEQLKEVGATIIKMASMQKFLPRS
jgi:hypothetical protein